MALFQMRWLRKFVRRHTNPIEHSKAVLWRNKLSIAYAVLAWNAFGMVCYMVYTGRSDWAHYYGFKSDEEAKMSPAVAFSKQFKLPHANVIRFSGFKKTEEYEIVNNFDDEKK